MLKGSKDYLMLKQGTYTSLLITFLIFNQFSIRKKFWKAETWTFPTIQMLCMLKHIEGVKSYFDLQPLQHALTYIIFDVMVGKVQVSAFQNFFQIENWLNIMKVMSKNVMSPYSIFWRGQRPLYTEYTFKPFDISKMSNITLYTVLCKSGKHHFRPFQHE